MLREYVAQLVEYNKKFLIIGNQNAITYKEIFKLIKDNKIWLGINNGPQTFKVPMYFDGKNVFIEDNQKFAKFGNICWFTNIEHKQRHEPLKLMSMSDNLKFNKKIKEKGYPKYDNYDAIDVPFVKAIPNDYEGVMGVSITFLNNYCPEQFEIIGMAKRGAGDPTLKSKVYTKNDYLNYSDLNAGPVLINNGLPKNTYPRILIKLQKMSNENKRQ